MYIDSLLLIHVAYFVKIVRCEINHISLGKSSFSVHKYDFNRASFRVLRHVWLFEDIADDVLNRPCRLTERTVIETGVVEPISLEPPLPIRRNLRSEVHWHSCRFVEYPILPD